MSNELQKRSTPAYAGKMIFLAVLLVVLFFASLCIGSYMIGLDDIFNVMYANTLGKIFAGGAGALSGAGAADSAGTLSGAGAHSVSSQVQVLLLEVRVPRVIICVFVGAALSVAGAAYQGLFQNPMCSQDVLGASSGAAFGAALGLLFGASGAGVSVFAFVFGLLAVALSLSVSKIGRTGSILALILAGMVVSSLFSSGVSAIKLVADTEEVLPAITYWLMGSLTGVRSRDVFPTLALIIIASIPIFVLRWKINLLATGEDEAKSMGVNTRVVRLVVIGAATFLTATCISTCGLIGWVGLVIPHFVRLFVGNDYRRVVPACMLMGASFLLVVDDIARMATTSEIPIGILTSFVGAPIFLFLIKQGGKNALRD